MTAGPSADAPARSARSALRLVTAGAALALALAVAWIAAQLVSVPEPTFGNSGETRLADFRDTTYFPARDLLTGHDPYDPVAMAARWPVDLELGLYAPSHLALALPWGLLPYRPAALGYAAAAVALSVALVAVAVLRVPPRWRPAWLLGGAALLLASYVGEVNVYLGQVNPLLACGLAGGLTWRTSRPRLAAALFSLAWIKPQFGIPVAVLLVAAGSWPVAVGGTAVAFAASLPVVGVLVAREGVGGFLDVVRRNLEFSSGTPHGATTSFTSTRSDLVPVLVRVFGEPGLARLELPVLVVVLGLGALLVARRRAAAPALLTLAIIMVTLVCIVHQPGDLLVVVPAAVAAGVLAFPRTARRLRLVDGAAQPAEPLSRPVRAALVLALVGLALPFAHQGFVDAALNAVAGERAAGTVDGVLVVTAAAAAVAALALTRGRRA